MIAPNFETITSGGVLLRTVVEGDGPLVVLLHGFPQCWYLWRHQIAPLAEAGYQTLGSMGTRTAMQSKMYGRLPTPNIVQPSDEFLDRVHQSYVDMATVGAVTEAQRQVFFDCGRDLRERQGAEAVLLGGTDLFLAFDGRDCGFEVIDCALMHIEELAREAAR